MGEMVGEVTLICGRVAEREIGGCSSARYRDPIVSYSEPLQGPGLLLGTVTASYYRISSRPPRQPVVIVVGGRTQCSNNHGNHIVQLLNEN